MSESQEFDDAAVSKNEPNSDFAVGDRVRLAKAPPYFKTADPMPMLRPPDLVGLEETGIITEQRVGQTWVVKFDRGSFLLDTPYLAKEE